MRIADLQTLDDDALGQLLARSIDALPEADPGRLSMIRDRLPLHQAVTASTNRWIQLLLIAVLSGSGLAAAWWGVETFFYSKEEVQQLAPASHTAPLPHNPSVNEQHSEPGETKQSDDRRSPIIFQQEQY